MSLSWKVHKKILGIFPRILCIVLFMGRFLWYNECRKRKGNKTMAFFVIVSAIVLLSVLWDSTEDFRRKLRRDLQEEFEF